MSVLSCLRPPLIRGARFLTSSYQRKNAQHVQRVIKRQMGGVEGDPPSMLKVPSRAVYNTFKDELHFFVFLGLIPTALVITAFNILGGRGELADIPEGYQPHYWEYEKSPISRFIIKNVGRPLEKQYEQNLHYQWLDGETVKRRQLAKKIKNMMRENQDYKAWYYIPVDKNQVDNSRRYADDAKERRTSF